ncbi:Hydrophobe/amphiphile efflux-3 HAE3 [Methanospirillum hungatei JF-1]|uniref:Hydrophobe/amphiphile efflux-3 HAE3 n=1 Tax=Methanospirillum hungatei JF-1 (strain ATCC 27890 / DSM 864 / NBRC 100397 / JF-1) TaxID=323259 RepID=Q2FRM3_METHJ|nr:hydrophobe/amphiphile efflux-3 (HAE3) family transporter [Methanospirillum hungatei]ABD41671.1 Hydrophobe/amphiphile efflux-3 HAE3 [Methanospirillum hungatei JF-1]
MFKPFDWLAYQITRHPGVVAGVALAAFIVALYGTTLITMQTGNEAYLDKNTPRGALLAHYADTYGSDAIMVIIESDDVTKVDNLWYIDNLLNHIQNQQSVERTSSIVALLKQGNNGVLPRSSAEVKRIIQNAPAEIVSRNLPSNMMTLGVITLVPGLSEDRQKQVLSNIETIVKTSRPPPGVSVTLSGEQAFNQEMGREMGSSMGILIMAAMILMVIAVLALFSHVRYALLPVVIVAAGLVLTFGLMGLTGTQISMVVIGAFPVLIGIGIDYAIQIHSRLDEEIYKTSLPEAVTTTITKTSPSVMVAMLATSTGFIAMIFGPIPMVGDFGITCTFGVMSCYIAALILVPVFAMLIQYRGKRQTKDPAHDHDSTKGTGQTTTAYEGNAKESLIEKYDRILGNTALKIAQRPVPVLLFVFIIAAIGFTLDNEVPISADQKTFVPPDMPALLDMNKVTRTMGATTTIPIIVSADDVLHPENLAWIQNFGAYVVRKNDKVTDADSIASLIAEYNNGTLPKTRFETTQILSAIPDQYKKRYLNGNTEAVIEFSTRDMEIKQARDLIKIIRKDMNFYPSPPGLTIRVTGSLEMFSTLMDDIDRSKTFMTILGFVFIFGYLLLVYRRLKAAVPLIPIIVIVGWNGAIMYLIGLDYTPLTAVLGSMTIGVASEYTILIMERCDEELARGLPLFDAIQVSVQKIGTAITVSGLTTVFGFAALMLSEFNIVANFGITTVITVVFSLTGAIFIMPAVISLVYQFQGQKV